MAAATRRAPISAAIVVTRHRVNLPAKCELALAGVCSQPTRRARHRCCTSDRARTQPRLCCPSRRLQPLPPWSQTPVHGVRTTPYTAHAHAAGASTVATSTSSAVARARLRVTTPARLCQQTCYRAALEWCSRMPRSTVWHDVRCTRSHSCQTPCLPVARSYSRVPCMESSRSR